MKQSNKTGNKSAKGTGRLKQTGQGAEDEALAAIGRETGSMVSRTDLFSNIRLASRTLTNLYNANMPTVKVNAGASLSKEIPLKVTQLVVLQALYDTSWWGNCLSRRLARTGADRRERMACYYKKHKGMVVQIDLSKQLGLDCTTICRNLKALVESGWVTSKRSEVSQREVLVGLTSQGRQVVESALERASATSERLGESLGSTFVSKLNNQLRTVVEKCNDLMDK